MKYAIVYSSTGNTKTLADVVKQSLPEDECIYFGDDDDKALEADIIYIGFWTNKGLCDEKTLAFLKKLTNQDVFLFGSAGFGMSDIYFQQILTKTEAFLSKDVKVKGRFMCQGKMPMSVKERYLKMKEEKAPVPNIDMMIKNFDEALSHPDENDFSNLKKELAKVN